MDILLFHFRGVGGLEDQFWLSKVGVQDYFNDRPLIFVAFFVFWRGRD